MSAPEDNWRDRAACAGTAPLWDDVIDGESHDQRTDRQAKAVAICRSCPVTEECRRERNPTDGGVWAGDVFTAPRTSNRGRPARLPDGENAARAAARRPCRVCGLQYRADGLRRHLLRHQGMAS